jgi:hypothetical protein
MQLNRTFEIFLPYCAKRIADGRYVLLNRCHAPVGCPTQNLFVPESCPITLETDVLTPEFAASISATGDPNVHRIYLYNSSCEPWSGEEYRVCYQKRLAALLVRARYRFIGAEGTVTEINLRSKEWHRYSHYSEAERIAVAEAIHAKYYESRLGRHTD